MKLLELQNFPRSKTDPFLALWSWAVLLELDLDPEDVFHGTAYKGGDSANIIDCARCGIYLGFPLI